MCRHWRPLPFKTGKYSHPRLHMGTFDLGTVTLGDINPAHTHNFDFRWSVPHTAELPGFQKSKVTKQKMFSGKNVGRQSNRKLSYRIRNDIVSV